MSTATPRSSYVHTTPIPWARRPPASIETQLFILLDKAFVPAPCPINPCRHALPSASRLKLKV